MCGAAYESCYGCEKAKSWRVHTDTADHYYILLALMEYKGGHDAKRAYRALRKRDVDFQSIDGYEPSVQKLLCEIYEGCKGKALNARKPITGESGAQSDAAEETAKEN